MNFHLLKVTTIILVIILFFYLNLNNLYSPPFWPDEAYIADITRNLINEGKIGTNLWDQMIPGATHHVLWYPPVLFYILAFWLKLTGFSLESQRYLSIIIGASSILMFYQTAKFALVKQFGKFSNSLFFSNNN